jgi:hypothetical protein
VKSTILNDDKEIGLACLQWQHDKDSWHLEYIRSLHTLDNRVDPARSMANRTDRTPRSLCTQYGIGETQKSVPLFPTDWQHSMGHVILTPGRLLCRYDFGRYCASERYNLQGYTWYSELIMHFADWINWTGAQETFWTKLWMATIRWLATVGITLPFSLLYGMECLLFGNGVVGMEKTGRGGEWNDEGKGWMTAAVTIVLTVYIFHRRSQSVK